MTNVNKNSRSTPKYRDANNNNFRARKHNAFIFIYAYVGKESASGFYLRIGFQIRDGYGILLGNSADDDIFTLLVRTIIPPPKRIT